MITLRTLALAMLAGNSLFGAAVVAPGFSGTYTIFNLGSAPGVTTPYGGLIVKADDTDTLLLSGAANSGGAVIDALTLVRDANNHITGFSGSATQFATAPNIDGGLTYAPNGDLLYTAYPSNRIGEIKPGSTVPDKIVTAPVGGSVGTLQFVPQGFAGAGNLVIGSYSAGTFCNSTLTADGLGTYDISGCTNSVTTGRGPEGLIYVPLGSDLFGSPSALISEYATGTVSAYTVDSNGIPTGVRQDFITGLNGAEGAAIDPLTGDFLFSTFGNGNQVFAVRGFVAPPSDSPEPGTMALLGTALVAVYSFRRKFIAK